MNKYLEIFFIFFRLGCTSFGGPIAHLGYFHHEFVEKRKWLTEVAYSDLVALSQFLPGPASSQVGMALGSLRGGILGSLLSFLGFTLPSFFLMTSFGLGMLALGSKIPVSLLHGLQLSAVAIIIQAVWQMGNKLCPDKERILICIGAAIISSIVSGIIGQIFVIVFGGFIGYIFLRKIEISPYHNVDYQISKPLALFFLFLFLLFLFGFPILRLFWDSNIFLLFDSFYRTGSLVFGGGHVVISLLEDEIVAQGILSKLDFLSGYGFAQGIPGPLFTISSYIGAMNSLGINGMLGAIICSVAAFLPAYFLILGILPFWNSIRKFKVMLYMMSGINAAVVGLLLSVLYDLLYKETVINTFDFYLLLIAVILLQKWKLPSWMVLVLTTTICYSKDLVLIYIK
ncbi:MAG: chromate efflux transporter [Leptospira sp.]|nr:chromate efflux transporter [Leptospira sp.]